MGVDQLRLNRPSSPEGGDTGAPTCRYARLLGQVTKRAWNALTALVWGLIAPNPNGSDSNQNDQEDSHADPAEYEAGYGHSTSLD